MTNARACKRESQEGSLGITSHAPGSARECERMNPHHSSDIRNTSIFWRCSKRSIFKYFKKNIIKIQRLENWPLYNVFLSIFLKAQKYVKYAYVWIELRICHYYDPHTPKWAPTLGVGVPMDSEFFKNNCKGQNPLDWGFPYIIRKLLEHRCPKWARMTHLDT
jgi:hypothetical protein